LQDFNVEGATRDRNDREEGEEQCAKSRTRRMAIGRR
jgi:hypothetical protein